MRYKVGDKVIVITGNDKGKQGKINEIKGDRLIVEGVNARKKHQKPTADGKKGAIVEFNAPIHVSNVSFAVDGKAVKVKARINEEGKKELYFKTKDNESKLLRVAK